MILTFLGDIAFNGIISTEPGKNIDRYMSVIKYLSESDLSFANLEVPVRKDDEVNEFKKFIHFSLPGPTADLLKMMNIGCVSLANNHIYDCKMSGLMATIKILDDLGIYHTGAGWLPEHTKPVIINSNGVKIAFLAYVDQSTNPKTEEFPELLINYFDQGKVTEEIRRIRKQADIVILSLHWGVDYSYYPTLDQIKSAHTLIHEGVDIIMGHHPHTLQPFEKYDSGYIYYSLGGLTFGDYQKKGKKHLQALFRKTKKGVIVQYDMNLDNNTYISTFEKKGNFVSIINRDYRKWSKCKWDLYNIKYWSSTTKAIYNFKERVIDRLYEYFFGYYRNLFVRLFQVSNIKKIRKLFE